MSKSFIAIDLGATSGRIVLYEVKNKTPKLIEVHRFSNYLINDKNLLYWDFNLIIKEIIYGLQKSFKITKNIVSIGIDTFGVDFGILNDNNELLKKPLSYRNNLGIYSKELVNERVSNKTLYNLTGIQYMPFNTLYQLVYLDNKMNIRPKEIILLPDLIAYYLTGEKRTEMTNFSTTNLMNVFSKEVITQSEKLNINSDIFPKFIKPGEKYGYLKNKFMKEFDVNKKIEVVAVCSHDTASAILSIPTKRSQLFLSSGTWSLLGTLLPKPNISNRALKYNYSNELGYNNQIRFLKNIMGMWIINETLKVINKKDNSITHDELNEKMLHVKPFVSFIDVDHPSFNAPSNMIEAIQKYCLDTNQKVPESYGELTMTIYQSLVFKYRKNIEELEYITRRKFNRIYVVGGGSNIEILNQMIASATNKKVIIGHSESTVIGNLLIQLKRANIIENIDEGIKMFNKNEQEYLPNQIEDYEEAYVKFLEILEAENGE